MLLASGVHPRNVAAITFTELAASELLQRIEEYVRELGSGNVPEPLQIAMGEDFAEEESEPLSLAASAADGLTDKQMESLSSAAAALDELTCTTIHGFCQRLTTPYPIEANVDGCGNDGRGRIRSGPQDVAAAVAPKCLEEQTSG